MNEISSVRLPTQERAVRTRAALVEAAQREFSRRGYAATTARSIAKEAKVSTGSFYQYFVDKDAVLRELGKSRFERVTRRVFALLDVEGSRPDPDLAAEVIRERLRKFVDAITEYHREDPGLHEVLTERRHHDPKLEQPMSAGETILIMKIAELLRWCGHGGDVEAIAFVVFGMIEGVVHTQVLGNAMVDDDRCVAALVEALFRVTMGSLQGKRSES